MYYKIITNNEIIDVLFNPFYVVQSINGMFKRAQRLEAQGVRSSDGNMIWHVEGFKPLPGYQLVQMVEITEKEYELLKEALLSEKKPIEEASETQPVLKAEELTLKMIREYKIKIMSQSCSEKIKEGVKVFLSDGKEHYFELSLEDQINLLDIQTMITSGVEDIPYHEKNLP